MVVLHLGILSYIYSMYGLFHHCAIVIYEFLLIVLWILYLCLLLYVCVLYIIYYFVVLHLGESCCVYFLICSYTVAILFDLHPQKWINISSLELVVTFIETHIFATKFSISHIFLSVIYIYIYFLLLGELFTFHIQHSKTCNQHYLYTILEKITSFSLFIFGHTRIQYMTLTNREGVFIFHLSSQEVVCVHIGSSDTV